MRTWFWALYIRLLCFVSKMTGKPIWVSSQKKSRRWKDLQARTMSVERILRVRAAAEKEADRLGRDNN